MGIVDYILLAAGLVGLVLLIAISPTVRIVLSQSLFHPLGSGHIAIWEDEVEYFDGPAQKKRPA